MQASEGLLLRADTGCVCMPAWQAAPGACLRAPACHGAKHQAAVSSGGGGRCAPASACGKVHAAIAFDHVSAERIQPIHADHQLRPSKGVGCLVGDVQWVVPHKKPIRSCRMQQAMRARQVPRSVWHCARDS